MVKIYSSSDGTISGGGDGGKILGGGGGGGRSSKSASRFSDEPSSSKGEGSEAGGDIFPVTGELLPEEFTLEELEGLDPELEPRDRLDVGEKVRLEVEVEEIFGLTEGAFSLFVLEIVEEFLDGGAKRVDGDRL